MADRGEWTKADLKFKEVEYKNLVEREQIQIERWELAKKEISLKIEDLDLNIKKALAKQESYADQSNWCRKKITEFEND